MQHLDLFSEWEEDATQAMIATGKAPMTTEAVVDAKSQEPPVMPLPISLGEAARATEYPVTVDAPSDSAPQSAPKAFLDTGADIRLQSAARILALGAARATHAARSAATVSSQASETA